MEVKPHRRHRTPSLAGRSAQTCKRSHPSRAWSGWWKSIATKSHTGKSPRAGLTWWSGKIMLGGTSRRWARDLTCCLVRPTRAGRQWWSKHRIRISHNHPRLAKSFQWSQHRERLLVQQLIFSQEVARSNIMTRYCTLTRTLDLGRAKACLINSPQLAFLSLT